MKFKMQDKQNQLIERISDKHLVVGVDIAQQTHVARAVNYRGIVVGDPLSFENNEDGFARLLDWINKLKNTKGLDTEIVGMEPTGHYWLNLSQWLYDQNIDVVTVNPHLVKKNKENRDNTQSKSDKKDALVIADMVKNGYYSFIRPTTEAFEKLRVLMANRDSVVKRSVSAANQIHRWVDIIFPELRQVFKDVTHLAEASSGKWKGQIVVSKRGRSRLRRFLYLATMCLVMNNPEFREIHAHNVKVKKMKKMKSIMKLIGKFARMIVGIARRNEPYCPEKVQPLTPLAA